MQDDFSTIGYETLSIDPLDEYRARGIHLRHRGSGAQVYRVVADDPENMVAFAFRTPPSDHTGVAHILEHAVLCGSERYPLKDPFLVMLKGSAHTFLNAMTYPDKTVYPAASTVKADFLNLLRVYGDAVFFPQLKREVFEQEGHRLEFDDEGRLVRSGIVLNEMKGSYSSEESVAGDWTLRSLFPDSPYSWDSGGDPDHIPELDYASFRDFHARWYHASNSRIFLYGDHDTEEVLRILDGEFLGRFERREVPSSIPLQSRWSAPRRLETLWPSAPGESTDARTTISLNWLLGESTDPVETLSAQVLSFILLGHGGAPLQKAVIDSGIGEDLSPVSGLETDLRQMVFSVAVRGTDAPRRDDFEELVNRTLSGLADGGLGSDLVEGALRTTEFRSREIRGGRPFGMRLMRRALRGWLHDRPPLESLAFEAPMAELRRRAVPGYFEDIIRSWLLENPHRSTVTVAPDPDLQNRREEDERRLLDEMQSSLGDAVDDLKASLDRLEQFQETPDRPEDLARIPFLTRGDLPTEVIRIPVDDGRRGGIIWYRQDTFANGVAYLEAAFDLSAVDAELQPWLPLFGRALTDVGLPGRGYDDVARELAMKTGGLACSLEASPVHPSAGGGLKRSLFVHLKALSDQWSEAVALTGELMRSADFADIDRIGDLLVELRNDTRSAVVPSGHAFASLRAASRHSSAASWEDLWYGVGQLRFLDAAVSRSGAAQEASRALLAIRDRVFRRNGVHLAVTGDSDRAEAALEDALRLIETLPEAAAGEAEPPELFRHPHRGEGLSTATAVSFSAVSLPNPVLGSPDQAWSELLAHILRTGYLWEQIRMKGGAYGASASVSPLEGTFTFSTYRDPLIAPSLEAFRSALDWAVEELDDATVDLAVIGAVGRELRPMGPGERGAVALKRRMYGITDDLRQSRRDVQLVSGASELRRAAARLRDVWDERSTTVIGASDALDDAAAAVPELSESRIELPS